MGVEQLSQPSGWEVQVRVAGQLSLRADRYRRLGRYDDAVEVSTRIVAIYERLVADDPEPRWQSNLAAALNNHGSRLTRLGRHQEALDATAASVQRLRELPGSDLTLAHVLVNLGLCFHQLGRYAEAVVADAEAVAIERRLAIDDPGAEQPRLAGSLNNLAIDQRRRHRHEEALAASTEAVELSRRVPGLILAMSLHTHSVVLAAIGRDADALAAGAESVCLFRADPGTDPIDLAEVLTDHAAALSRAQRHTEAVAVAGEALALLRGLTEPDVRRYEGRVADGLATFAEVHLSTGEVPAGARAAAEEAVARYGRLALDRPGAFTDALRHAESVLTRLPP